MRRIACLALLILSAAGWAIASDATPSTKPSDRPAWCRPGYICIPRAEMSAATIRLIDLQEENARLKARIPRYGKLWATVGMEYLPNDTRPYHAYALGGLDIGHVGFWAGTFGDSPALGVGWRFYK